MTTAISAPKCYSIEGRDGRIGAISGIPHDKSRRTLARSRARVEDGPSINGTEPFLRQTEFRLYSRYG